MASSPTNDVAVTFLSTSRESASRTRFAKYNFNGTEKIAIVLAGWKPELSEAAADAKQTIKKEVARGDAPVSSSGNNSSGGGNKSTSKINEVKSYSKKSSIAKDF